MFQAYVFRSGSVFYPPGDEFCNVSNACLCHPGAMLDHKLGLKVAG
jgi:hypothetical protein